MGKTTEQIRMWTGAFGKEYTDRNALTTEQMDEAYKKLYGVTGTELYQEFLGGMDRSIKILEVGSNIGNKLLVLQGLGFRNLYGIEISSYAIERAKVNTKGINIIQASAFDIPFKDGYFDIVFTAGVLIHIAPADITRALKEIHRCSREYIWGTEYYADSYTEVEYRGNSNLLWKTDFSSLYLNSFEDLELVKEKKLKYLDNENVDTMYLLKKVKGSN
ncbi:MAG: methyltransferase domain-containing protein [Phycisphaerae bacterium]|nr:methyltransferase domain-containing protein [Phycisphaerae bacterium]